MQILVPWRSDGAERETNWAWVRQWWEGQGYEVVTGDSTGPSFNRAAARNAAARQVDSDVLLFVDADTIAEPRRVAQAVEVAQTGLAYPHNRCVHLSALGTTQLKEGYPRPQVQRTARNSPAGVLAISRDLFSEIRGWDEGFTEGWGYEDVVFMLAAETLGRVHRLAGNLTHLWHPIAPEKADAMRSQTVNRPRSNLYRAAYRNPEAMRRVLELR
jgi:glycosyltransferase involved in cell wall biosynthesis